MGLRQLPESLERIATWSPAPGMPHSTTRSPSPVKRERGQGSEGRPPDLCWLGGFAQVRFDRRVTGEAHRRVGIRHCRDDDHIVTGAPVGWGRHLVGGGQLQRVEYTQNLAEIA